MKTLVAILSGMLVIPYLVGSFIAWDLTWPLFIADWSAPDRAVLAFIYLLFCLTVSVLGAIYLEESK